MFALAGTVAKPMVSFAQPSPQRIARIGFVSPRARPASVETDSLGGFVHGMRELGYEEGRNIRIEWRFADGNYARLPDLLAELISLKVEVIVAAAGPAAVAAKAATSAIPIVFGGTGDPVGLGLVKSLARPGGNVTGVSNSAADFGGKNMELLRAIAPKLTRVAILANRGSALSVQVSKQVQTTSAKAKLAVLPMEASSLDEIDAAFRAIAQSRADALIVTPDPFLFSQARRIATRALELKLPSIGFFSEHAEGGGLLSYGQNQSANYRRVAAYVDKILKGARPADLPVEQPMVLELVINRKTAGALGITVPQEFLLRADRVIE